MRLMQSLDESGHALQRPAHVMETPAPEPAPLARQLPARAKTVEWKNHRLAGRMKKRSAPPFSHVDAAFQTPWNAAFMRQPRVISCDAIIAPRNSPLNSAPPALY